jgi:hypothetical protein
MGVYKSLIGPYPHGSKVIASVKIPRVKCYNLGFTLGIKFSAERPRRRL